MQPAPKTEEKRAPAPAELKKAGLGNKPKGIIGANGKLQPTQLAQLKVQKHINVQDVALLKTKQ